MADAEQVERLAGALDDAMVAASAAQDRVSELAAEIGAGSAPALSLENLLDEARADRDAAARTLGVALLAWTACGGEIALTLLADEPGDEPSAASAPVETVARDVVVDGVVDGVAARSPAAVPAAEPAPAAVESPQEPAGESPSAAPEATDEPPSPSVEETPEVSPPPDPVALARLVGGGLSPGWSRAAVAPVRAPRPGVPAAEILAGLPGPDLWTDDGTLALLPTLLNAVTRRLVEVEASALERPRAILGLLAALARHLQDEVDPARWGPQRGGLDEVFGRLTAWSAAQRPGFVVGLARHQTPADDEAGSWRELARRWWDRAMDVQTAPQEIGLETLEQTLTEGVERETLQRMLREVILPGRSQSDPDLVRLLVPYPDLLKGSREFKTLRQNVRRFSERLERQEALQDRGEAPADAWSGIHLTQGRSAMILGGDTRPRAMRRIREGLALASLEWESGWQIRRLEQIAERVRSGRLDLVIYLVQFASHTTQNMLRPTCQAEGVPFVMVDRGYGVAAVRRAIEGQRGAQGESASTS